MQFNLNFDSFDIEQLQNEINRAKQDRRNERREKRRDKRRRRNESKA